MYSTVKVVASCVIVGSIPQPPPPRPPPRPPPPPAGAPAGAAAASSVHLPAKFGFACARTPTVIMTTAAALSTVQTRFIVESLLTEKQGQSGDRPQAI